MKKRILITNRREAKKIQLELFSQGYRWYNDVIYDKQQELMLTSTWIVYPIFINLEKDKMLSWTENSELNTTLKKEFRKQKLLKLNEL